MRPIRVLVVNEGVTGTITKLLAHGAEVQYAVEGIKFVTYLPAEDYIELEGFDSDE